MIMILFCCMFTAKFNDDLTKNVTATNFNKFNMLLCLAVTNATCCYV